MIVRSLRGLAAAMALVAVVASVSEAQMKSASRFAIQGGVSLPNGDFGDAADMGFQVGGSYTMQMNDQYSLRFNADYSRYAVASNPIFDGNWSQLGLFANAMMGFGDMGVYGLVGLGFVNTGLSVDGGGSDSQSDFAFNVGGGWGKNNWAIEARYQSVQADGGSLNTLPIVFVWKF